MGKEVGRDREEQTDEIRMYYMGEKSIFNKRKR